MELKQLISFLSVADTRSMKMAAMRCNITISTISKHIKSLEDELGILLFERKKSDIVITEDGEQFVQTARNIINESENYKNNLASKKGKLSGELRIGVGQFIAPYIRTAAIEFMRDYEDVRLVVHFDRAEVLNKMLRNGELDIAFTMNESYHYEGIVTKPCISFMLSAIMSKNHKFASKQILTFDDLMQCRIVMPDCGERVFQTFQRYTSFDLSKLPVVCINNNAGETLMVLDDLDLITFLPSHYIITSQKLCAKPIETLDMELKSNVHWIKEKPLKASAKKFLEVIKKIQSK